MKRVLAMLLLLTLTLCAASCIQLLPEEPVSGSESDHTDTESQSDLETETEPVPGVPSLPWTDARAAAEAMFAYPNGVVDLSRREYSYAEMEEDLAILAARYPKLFSYRSFGKSVAGRELYVATLGDPNAAQKLLVSAGIHGREYLTPLLVMKQMEFLLAHYENGDYQGMAYADLFADCCLYVIPMSNPDGIMLSQAGIGSLTDPDQRATVQAVYEDDFRKGYTSQTDINEYLKYWKANANGVDLNRNFDALWENYRMGEPEPCHKNYKGPEPMSEPETRALAALTDSLSGVVAVLCIHSQGEVLYWDCGQEDPLRAQTYAFTDVIGDRSGYELIREQNNDASYSDWCALERDLIAVTVETGKGLCPLDLDKFEAIWFDNYDLLALSAAYFCAEE